MAYVTLVLLLVAVGIALCAVLLSVMALHLLRPPRMTDGKAMYLLHRLTPADLGLAYETQWFDVRDPATGGRLRIAGWWMPALVPDDRTAIICHGYSDAKVGGIAWAPLLQSLGFNVLAIDLRAHGESDGRYSTAGYFERDDLEQVIDHLRQIRPHAARRVLLFGVSLGATVVSAVGARRDDLMAVVMESPYTTFLHAITAHGRRMAMPLERLYGVALWLAERFSGARFGAVAPVDLIPQVQAPLLLISSGADTFVSADDQAALAAALARRPANRLTRHVTLPDAEHTRGLAADPAAYRAALEQFLIDAA